MIKLPAKFKEKLETGENPFSFEISIIWKNFSQIYSENNTYFFNEYTDHGFRHINSVLNAINDLIPEEYWNHLSSKDIFILVVSVLLHDLGMHIQPLTFSAIVKGEYDDIPSYGFKNARWSELWNEYIDEAKKWNEEELFNLLGQEDFDTDFLPLNKFENLNEAQKKIVGEFIRRYHPRIAFEIAFKGLKSNSGKFIDLCPNLEEDLRFMSGLVALSHGKHVRDLFMVLQARYSLAWRVPQNVHIFYLMVLLRLADYIQIDDSRIHKVPFQTKLFKSPISIFEHKKHFSITFLQSLIDDPETLYFNASPADSTTFSALKNLFGAIQTEFDTSWSILGEIYGSAKYKPALKYRRIKSNLEDPAFVETLTFVPELISFSADKDLLKLLIAPLYGYDPTYGIREILQNSIDACWERKMMEDGSYAGEVLIRFHMDENKRTVFSISDNGKGMTLNEIRNYFLRAGSSVKTNREWKRKFMKANKVPSIHRIGKFGIGVLASYLLGDEIRVETKSYNSEIGYRFKTTINDSNIEIEKDSQISVGTSITIHVADEIRNVLFRSIGDRLAENVNDFFGRFSKSPRWDRWYTLNDPSVKIQVYNFPIFSPLAKCNPSFFEEVPKEWNLLETGIFERVLWTYNKRHSNFQLTCNGIVIPEGYSIKESYLLNIPFVSVFDFKGNMNLKLNRNGLLGSLPFERELTDDIYRHIVYSILSYLPPYQNGELLMTNPKEIKFRHPALKSSFKIMFTNSGYVVNIPFFNSAILDKRTISIAFQRTEGQVGDEMFNELKIKLSDFFVSVEALPFRATYDNWESEEYEDPLSGYNDVEVVALESDYIQENIVKHNQDSPSLKVKVRTIYSKLEAKDFNGFVNFCNSHYRGDTVIPYSIEERKTKFNDLLVKLNLRLFETVVRDVPQSITSHK